MSLAIGPDNRVTRYNACNVNGYRFHTIDREKDRKTQNSGVVVKGEHDRKTIQFYGVVTDIIEVEYLFGPNKVLVFKCDWWNVGSSQGIVVDKEWNTTSINHTRTWYLDQPFVLASQAEQVFYLKDMKLGGRWHIVEKVTPRGSYDVPEVNNNNDLEDDEAYQDNEFEYPVIVTESDEVPILNRGNTDFERRIEAGLVLDEAASRRERYQDDDMIVADYEIEQLSSSDDEQDEQILATDDDLDSN